MRLFLVPLAVMALLTLGCGDDPAAPGGNPPSPTVYEIKPVTNWFVTSPDIELSQFSSVRITVTFTSNVAGDMTFKSSPQFQLWSDPDAYDFVSAGDVTIIEEPSGTVGPGSILGYDLVVDLTGVPADQEKIAIRPKENSVYGTLEPAKISVDKSEVTFTK